MFLICSPYIPAVCRIKYSRYYDTLLDCTDGVVVMPIIIVTIIIIILTSVFYFPPNARELRTYLLQFSIGCRRMFSFCRVTYTIKEFGKFRSLFIVYNFYSRRGIVCLEKLID